MTYHDIMMMITEIKASQEVQLQLIQRMSETLQLLSERLERIEEQLRGDWEDA